MKMKKIRKLLVLSCLLAAAAVFSLQGCGPKTEQKEDTEKEDTQKEDGAAEDGDAAGGETTSEEGAPTVAVTDTIRWFNASYAILTELNGLDYNIFAGTPVTPQMQAMQIRSLEEWWGVTDRESADETLAWALNEGHRMDFKEFIESLQSTGIGEMEMTERIEYLKMNYDLSEEEAQLSEQYYEMYEQYGETAIDGWDYCRALNLVSFYYLAGYYTEQEALDKSLEIAQMVQPLFLSWDELVGSYLRGYEYWAEESSEERRGIYEDLLLREDNPYAVNYQTTLEKSW